MATKALFLIFEHSAGYALFERIESEELALECDTVEKSLRKLSTFSKTVTMRAFTPFPSSDSALENINAVAEGQCTSFLKSFLRKNLPKVKKMKNAKFELGVDDFKLASSVQEVAKVPCVSSDLVRELLRGVRVHFKHFINGLEDSGFFSLYYYFQI